MKIPEFKYHPDPIKTGAFSQGEYRKCDCCNESTNIWYSEPFYTAKDGSNGLQGATSGIKKQVV